MDPPLINETSFSAANPSSYTLAGIWPFPSDSGGEVAAAPVVGGNDSVLGLGMAIMGGSGGAGFGERDGSVEESTVTEQSIGNGSGKKRRDLSSEDESSKMVSTTTSGGNNDLSDSNGKRMKVLGSKNENNNLKAEVEGSSAGNKKPVEQSNKPSEPPKDYIHVRARRGQATDSHSLAERARREKISERMKILQDLVPGCNKVIGKALVLDEIINYIQSLQHQVEFLSMKLEAVNSRLNMHPTIDGFYAKDIFDATGLMFGPQATSEYAQGPQPEWLHMQAGGSFERAS